MKAFLKTAKGIKELVKESTDNLIIQLTVEEAVQLDSVLKHNAGCDDINHIYITNDENQITAEDISKISEAGKAGEKHVL